MCVHPTKSGEQCKRSPNEFLCSTHLVNLKVEQVPPPIAAQYQGKVVLAPSMGMIIEEVNAGDYRAATKIVVTPAARKPRGHVLCGACHEYHPNVAFVKVCYKNKRSA